MSKAKILVTGCAGFIGSHLTDRLLKLGHEVVGIDNFNDYYDPKIKRRNLAGALESKNFVLYEGNILDFPLLMKIFGKHNFDKIVHCAARAGVRASIADPFLYSEVNVLGTVNLLKQAVDSGVSQFVFTSSSSVYGNSPNIPFSEDDQCLHIISPYASSKRSAEIFVETFSKSYGLCSTVLRLFTVYGERGRPDMAPAKFTSAMLAGDEITQYGDGTSSRDYTYIGDIVDGIVKALDKIFGFEVINLGNNHPVKLSDFIGTLAKVSGKQAKIKTVPKQMGDVERTWAAIDRAKKLLSWEPAVSLEEGLTRYVSWFVKNY